VVLAVLAGHGEQKNLTEVRDLDFFLPKDQVRAVAERAYLALKLLLLSFGWFHAEMICEKNL
jgi:hypothetical protein